MATDVDGHRVPSRAAGETDAFVQGTKADGSERPVILLTEDDVLVGLDLREALEEAGYRVAGPFGREADARFWLAHETPDLGVLDLMLLDGPVCALVDDLRRLDVPFVVSSGRQHRERLARAVAGAPWHDKPAPCAAIVNSVKQLALKNAAR